MDRRKQSVWGRWSVQHVLPILAVGALANAAPGIAADNPRKGSMVHEHGSVPAVQQSDPGQGLDGTSTSEAGASPSTSAYQAMMRKMHEDQQIGFTGDPDRDFATHMIRHHQGAIDMARIELQYGRDPKVRELAEKIIADQQREIGIFQRWLETHSASGK